MLNILSAFCQQGVTINSKLTTIRSLLFTLLVFTFLWYNYYTSSIVSLLLNNKPETFKDIESVIDSDLTIGIENIAFKRILNVNLFIIVSPLFKIKFQATNHPTLRRMQELADKNDSKVDFYPQEVGISKTKNVGFSYFVESISAYNYIGKQFVNDEICNVNEVETLRPTMIYLVAKKRGPFNELLSITYRRFVQYGLVSRQNKIFCDEKPLCLQNKRFIQIGIEQVAPAFIILIFGYLLSIIIFLLEKIIY
ncbi:ionotropic receptor 75a-like isoform X2 [Onthophagus taurus]|uniref:ionotropic receptor 75a-like isoform X2 n=1 Tax=Onthophagus taurus TaxID=166361 RepID=UPI0039BDD262